MIQSKRNTKPESQYLLYITVCWTFKMLTHLKTTAECILLYYLSLDTQVSWKHLKHPVANSEESIINFFWNWWKTFLFFFIFSAHQQGDAKCRTMCKELLKRSEPMIIFYNFHFFLETNLRPFICVLSLRP